MYKDSEHQIGRRVKSLRGHEVQRTKGPWAKTQSFSPVYPTEPRNREILTSSKLTNFLKSIWIIHKVSPPGNSLTTNPSSSPFSFCFSHRGKERPIIPWRDLLPYSLITYQQTASARGPFCHSPFRSFHNFPLNRPVPNAKLIQTRQIGQM